MTRTRTLLLAVAALLLLGTVTAYLGSIQDDPELDLVRPEPTLNDDERSYVEFVTPRLDRLIEEGTAVSDLVAERSRNVLALSAHGTRIRTLSRQLISLDASERVPPRFKSSHADVVSAAGTMSAAIDEAEGMLTTLDFSGMSDLIPRFDRAVEDLREVRGVLPVADEARFSRTLYGREARHAGAGAHTRAGVAGADAVPGTDRELVYEV